MRSIPSYWLPRPALTLDAATRAEFEHLYAGAIAPGTGGTVNYALAAPKWQFLAFLADHYPIVLHGSGLADIDLFEPRQSQDAIAFGNQRAVYAAADGIWPMYFAIVDRDRFPMTLVNGCIKFSVGSGPPSEPYYYFSVSRSARAHEPWRSGAVYLLPAAGFVRQEPLHLDDLVVHIAQVASLAPVKPLAKLLVSPGDFPFLAQIRGHDDQALAERAAADPAGFPWLDPDE
jgi:hypothetical protein